jgi:hypothetical protein
MTFNTVKREIGANSKLITFKRNFKVIDYLVEPGGININTILSGEGSSLASNARSFCLLLNSIIRSNPEKGLDLVIPKLVKRIDRLYAQAKSEAVKSMQFSEALSQQVIWTYNLLCASVRFVGEDLLVGKWRGEIDRIISLGVNWWPFKISSNAAAAEKTDSNIASTDKNDANSQSAAAGDQTAVAVTSSPAGSSKRRRGSSSSSSSVSTLTAAQKSNFSAAMPRIRKVQKLGAKLLRRVLEALSRPYVVNDFRCISETRFENLTQKQVVELWKCNSWWKFEDKERRKDEARAAENAEDQKMSDGNNTDGKTASSNESSTSNISLVSTTTYGNSSPSALIPRPDRVKFYEPTEAAIRWSKDLGARAAICIVQSVNINWAKGLWGDLDLVPVPTAADSVIPAGSELSAETKSLRRGSPGRARKKRRVVDGEDKDGEKDGGNVSGGNDAESDSNSMEVEGEGTSKETTDSKNSTDNGGTKTASTSSSKRNGLPIWRVLQPYGYRPEILKETELRKLRSNFEKSVGRIAEIANEFCFAEEDGFGPGLKASAEKEEAEKRKSK